MDSSLRNTMSPLRTLEKSMAGGLGTGRLGVVMARAGVGKTAFVVQLGLDHAMRGQDVVHVAVGRSLEHVRAWYDALFDDLATASGLPDREGVRQAIARHRIIHAVGGEALTPDRLARVVDIFRTELRLSPRALLIDGYGWEGSATAQAADIGAFKALAAHAGAELWMSARTHREQTSHHPTNITPPCDAVAELVDVGVFLEPVADHVAVRLLKCFGRTISSAPALQLDCDTLRLVSKTAVGSDVRLPRQAYTLLSGGAAGAEATFGAAAERWGLREMTFSFPGRACARSRSVVELSAEELHRGEVSATYVESHLRRTFPKTEAFRKTLQTIWHQVETAGQIFVVGEIQPDQTVRGGTGWAAELAKHFRKPLMVYDQSQRGWFQWTHTVWESLEAPVIARTRFAGTGTRFLTEDGCAAIHDLFERSFGPA